MKKRSQLRLAISAFVKIGRIGSATALIIMTLAIGYEVFMRYVMNRPTIWVFEIGHYLLAIVMTWGLAYGLQTKAHITVEIVRQHISQQLRYWLDRVTSFLTVCVGVLLLWTAILFFLRTLKSGQVSTTILAVPLCWPQIGAMIGFFIFILMAAVLCWNKWRESSDA